MSTPLRIIQISDIHLFADTQSSLLGVNTQDSFTAVLSRLKNETMDLIILSGDLSQDGSEQSYLRLADMLKDFNVPMYYVPGNHDEMKIMTRIFPLDSISNHKHIVLKDWHLILLNSQKPDCVEGYLDISQLNYLQHCLQSYPEHRAVVFFHHHPTAINCAWLDEIGVTNAVELWEILSRYSKVSAIFHGHIHQQVEKEINGVQCFSVPSTCFQFKRNSVEFALEELNPGFRKIELHENGTITTEVIRTTEYIGTFDPNSKGYA